MKKFSFGVSASAAIVLAMIIYISDLENILAVLLAVCVHEFAHIAALCLLGYELKGFEISLKGFKLSCSEDSDSIKKLFAILAGPAAGLLLYILCCGSSQNKAGLWLTFTGRVSLYLSLFNLMPVFPLDGGNALLLFLSEFMDEKKAHRTVLTAGRYISLLLIALGLVFTAADRGVGLSAAGIWILCTNIGNADL